MPEFEVVGTSTDGQALVECSPELHPHVIVLDIGMPILNGLIAGERLKQWITPPKMSPHCGLFTQAYCQPTTTVVMSPPKRVVRPRAKATLTDCR